MLRSQVINNDLNPKWDEDFKILVHEPEHQVGAPLAASAEFLHRQSGIPPVMCMQLALPASWIACTEQHSLCLFQKSMRFLLAAALALPDWFG
jgi:hypothetical protein